MRNALMAAGLALALSACNASPSAPTVSISPSNPKTDADLKANIVSPASDPQGDSVTYSFVWLKDGAPQPEMVTDSVPAEKTTKGEVWTVVVTPSDGKLRGPTAQAQATIANTPPTATLAFIPSDPVRGTPLKVVASGTDADGDSVSFTYAWTKNGIATAFVTDTVPASELVRGQAWQVTVTPGDGTDVGQPVLGSVAVGNAKPVVASVALTPPNPTKATALFAQAAPPTDEDGDTVVLRYAWAVNGTVVDGQVGPNLASTFFQKGHVVTVSVTPHDGKEDGLATSTSVNIGNSAPTAPLPGIAARPKDSDDITCALVVSSTDLDAADSLTYAFTWTKNGQPFTGATSQATSSTVPAALTSEGDLLACSVFAIDGTVTVPGSAIASTKVNVRPVVAIVTLNPIAPTKSTTITAQLAPPTDADSDPVTLRYQWFVNGNAVAGVIGTSLVPSKFAKGASVSVVVTPNDGIEDGAPATASVVVGNAPPTAPVARVTSAPMDADDLTCSVDVPSADLDATDTLSYLFSWTRNSQPFTGATAQGPSSVVAASLTQDGDVFACSIATTDGTETVQGNTVIATVTANVDAGTGGGSCLGGPDAGTLTSMIGNLRSNICYGTRVKIDGAVVIAEGGETRATLDGGVTWSFDFWVADPASPENGIYVSKFKDDLVVDDQGATVAGWVAKPGDKVDLEGIFSIYYNDADRVGNRPGISDGFRMVKGNGGAGQLIVTLRGTTTPPADAPVPSGFGNGLKANPEFAGRRVHIPGSLTITSATPTALTRFSSDGGLSRYTGFEVTGGVLVNNQYTYRLYDGGVNATNCNWLADAAAGKTVTFPNGIAGVWDTYTHNPSPAQGSVAFVPGTADAGYTYVLYPVDCSTDLAGIVQ